MKKRKCKYIKIHTVRNTFVLHFEVLVCPRARVWKHIRASDNCTLSPITASEKQEKRESENSPDRRIRSRGLQHPEASKRKEDLMSSVSGEACQRARKGKHHCPHQPPEEPFCHYRRGLVVQPLPLRAVLTSPRGISLKHS